MDKEKRRIAGVFSREEINAAADRLYEHGLYQGYYSDFDYKITFTVYDDGEVKLMLVDRTHGFHHKVHHFEFKYPEGGGNKLIGEKLKDGKS